MTDARESVFDARRCEDCGHPWSSHTTGGMCMGDKPEGSECYCVMILPAEERAVIEEWVVRG